MYCILHVGKTGFCLQSITFRKILDRRHLIEDIWSKTFDRRHLIAKCCLINETCCCTTHRHVHLVLKYQSVSCWFSYCCCWNWKCFQILACGTARCRHDTIWHVHNIIMLLCSALHERNLPLSIGVERVDNDKSIGVGEGIRRPPPTSLFITRP